MDGKKIAVIGFGSQGTRPRPESQGKAVLMLSLASMKEAVHGQKLKQPA